MRTVHPAGLEVARLGISIRTILMESVKSARSTPNIWTSTVRAGISCEELRETEET